jgi:hypothetical protein
MRVFWVGTCLAAIAVCLGLAVGCGGGASSGSPAPPISNPTPTLASITPTSAVAGSADLMLSATGTGFVSGSAMAWNGVALTTSLVSSTQLQATVPASDLVSAGTAKITVMSPAPGGGSSFAINFVVNAPPNPVPAISALSPTQASAGGPGFTLTVTGTGFISGSQILWNDRQRTTVFQSSTSLSTQINSSDVSTAATVPVAVSNSAPGGGSSNVVNFSIAAVPSNLASNVTVLNIEGNDLAWVAQQQRLYVSVPADATSLANTIAVVDPVAGAIVTAVTATSAPGRLAATDDGQYLYAILGSENSMARYTLPAVAPDIKWTVGIDPNDPNAGLLTPVDVKAQPSAAHTVAVLRGSISGTTPLGKGLVVYDDGQPRATLVQNDVDFLDCLEWKADGSALFAQDILSSERSLYTFTVNAGGVTAANQYGGAFRRSGLHLHTDLQTGYAYSDEGEVVNPSTGLPIGNYPYAPITRISVLAAVDPSLGRVFLLTSTTDAGGNPAFLIRAYDQTKFRLLESFLIPGAVGVPVDFIRWGQSGLAFVTNGAANGVLSIGKLYILDGAFVNPKGPADGAAGIPLNPLPTLTALSAASAGVGSGSLTLTLSGGDFIPQAVVQWNGTTIPSTWVSNAQLQATVPGSNLANPAQVNVTVVNVGPGGGSSTPLPFSILAAPGTGNEISVYGVGGNDLVWDSQRQKIYVSAPGVQGALGNSIVIVDPVAGTIMPSAFVGSDPAELSLSSDGQFLYAGINGQNLVQRLVLPGLTADINFPLGSDSFDGPFYALGLKSAPGSPHTAAVSTGIFDASPSSTGITIFDDTTPRATRAPGWNTSDKAYADIEWGSDAATMYAPAQGIATDLYVLSVDGNGIRISKDFTGALIFPSSDFDVHFDTGTGLLYTDGGQVVRPSDATVVGTLGASGMVAPDSSLNRIFVLGQTMAQVGSFNFTIESFDQTSFAAIGSMTISNVVGTPSAFVRWGTNGLAFVTRGGGITDSFNIGPGQLYVISGAFVNSATPAGSAVRSPLASHVRKTWNSRRRNADRAARRGPPSLP